ncbi:hypothetical protein K7472_17060 [Streptomyces sp. PTM05]|uniref:Uncharacterized protein n=1 Tax=Streptantibioticus parmotrematis TaxID=2873249 RepID=A0ABS7QXR4_9ACTN|nr:hypothetical protein [Streptantibioticus parmotrematis]MBY8886562.1 hypothetical protein [Streptantibioticus parmotrematis]
MGKKSFRKVPDGIQAKIDALRGDSYQVGVRKAYSIQSLDEGAVESLGVQFRNGEVHSLETVLPSAENGRFSRWNLVGKMVRRSDLPKVERTWSVETPNFGDWGKGSHTTTFSRFVYPVEVLHGQQITISVAIAQDFSDEISIVFRVNRIFHRSVEEVRELVFALSLLQENVGSVDVVESEVSNSEWLSSVSVAWEFLPVGARDGVLSDLSRRIGIANSDSRRTMLEERMGVLLDLSPSELIYGTSGFQRYVGARFAPNLVAFENVEYGNALYVMFEQWEALSRLTRLELLAGPGRGFERIVHSSGWERRLRTAVLARRDT